MIIAIGLTYRFEPEASEWLCRFFVFHKTQGESIYENKSHTATGCVRWHLDWRCRWDDSCTASEDTTRLHHRGSRGNRPRDNAEIWREGAGNLGAIQSPLCGS